MVPFVCVYLFVLFQISGILNVCNSESFHGVSRQLQSLMSERFRLEEERLSKSCQEKTSYC